MWIVKLIAEAGLTNTNGEARRALQQGGVKLNDQKIVDINLEIDFNSVDDFILQVGKRGFRRIKKA